MSDIPRHVLEDGDTRITLLALGAAVQDWRLGDRACVLGFRDPESYRHNPGYLGTIVGRVANRIGGARYTRGGETVTLTPNEGANMLHGGPDAISHRLWTLDPDGPRRARLGIVSEDGENGFPGRVEIAVTLTLDGGRLTWDMEARPDRETPINLAQHLYFNLAGAGDIRAHRLRLRASRYTPIDAAQIPTGEIAPVEGTRFDFRSARPLDAPEGWDHNIALDPGDGPAAELTAPDGTTLRLRTDQPGLQVYSSNGLGPTGTPNDSAPHQTFAGLCLEAQGFPDAPNQPSFPPVFHTPDRPYRQITSVEIAPPR
ncbi:aldose epimerase family protein [Litorisediminicola beolgyonensis]|uniref:Aldose epimerase family protein n=1 Tax=Litorisediminicola beolgyonensis TaxID=1173614 RepID=A0ABW3ZK54_9RHOB